MEESNYAIRWGMSLLPEPSMLPSRSVFLQARSGASLTAIIEGKQELLPGNLKEFLSMCGGEVEVTCYYNEQTQRWETTPLFVQASGG